MSLEFTSRVTRRIYFLRRGRGYTQTDLSVVLGITRVGATTIEAGRQNISIEQISKIRSWLGISWSDLLDVDDMVNVVPPPDRKRTADPMYEAYLEQAR